MEEVKQVTIPLAQQFMVLMHNYPKTKEERSYMSKVPCANAMGCLMYLIVCTRPNLAHYEAIKWMFKNLKGNSHGGLLFDGILTSYKVVWYVDTNYVDDIDKKRSLTGYLFKFAKG